MSEKVEEVTAPSLDIVITCPTCGFIHVDKPETDEEYERRLEQHIDTCSNCTFPCPYFEERWTNPPHRSHKCALCGEVWRPADVPTNGVNRIKTRGKKDTWPRELKVNYE